MEELPMDHPDRTRTLLRSAVARLERALKQPETGVVARPLPDAFLALVKLLDLGPQEGVRACPSCGHLGMAAARLCGHCWTTLVPVASRPTASSSDASL